ncbi:MAG: proline--tRNA ligase [Planctomycetota bacterium]|nr:proline--tRNA ligase [Planctomycetota bacterium]
MRLTKLHVVTLRDDPADAEIPSHRLLARAGYIVKVASGLYTYGPLMWRTLKKISAIVREELDREEALEVMMPILHPKELWTSSGRWDRYVADGILFTLQDSKGGEFCLGPTHEEVITAYADQTITSYKQLPVNLYQIQDKFRDEVRPRYGLMRGREFIMMDAYSFDLDDAGLDASYAAMDRAYRAVFTRCGVDFRSVQADAGAIGGAGSEEFMVIADVGEDEILYCEESGYAANVEKAGSIPAEAPASGDPADLEKRSTPDVKSVAQLEEFFSMPASAMAKTVLYQATWPEAEGVVAVMMRGDLDVNEVKLVNALDCLAVVLADEATVKRVTGAEVGFAGPIGLAEGTRLLADKTLAGRTNLLTGCNETDFHCLNVNVGRDCPLPEFHDLRLARAGEQSPDGAGALKQARGIEVGHIFKLGTKYSTAMDATFIGEDGKPHPFVMGCYGIGVSRTAQAAVEQHHDDSGIVWPFSIAPFEVVVAIVDVKKEDQVAAGERAYAALKEAGIDVCLDDRKLRAGAKFKDLELLGFPVRLTAGRGVADDLFEVTPRESGEREDLGYDEAVARVIELVQAGRK